MTAAVWPILVPLTGAAIALLVKGRGVTTTGLATAAATLAASVHTAMTVWREGPFRYPLGGWQAPLGIDLAADGLTVVMLLMSGFVGAGISLYAAADLPPSRPRRYGAAGPERPRRYGAAGPERPRRYGAAGPERPRRYGAAGAERPRPHGVVGAGSSHFWPLWLFLWGALHAVFLSADVFNVYVALELLTLAGVGLVVLARGPSALSAAVRYLLAALLASLAYLLGVAILYGAFGALDMETLGARVEPGWLAASALALMTGGLLMKTALVPLHFWLPRAHASAVTPASAILSALMIKGSFYMTLRLWGGVFGGAVTVEGAQLVGGLGAAAIVWGGFQASRQHHLKLLVGYSTVSQIGYLFLLFPLAFPADASAPWREAALAGGVYQALTHAFAKAAMFLAAGLMITAAGSHRVEHLAGVAARLPLAVFAFGLAGLSIAGLPPSGGFVAKWLLLGATLEAGQWWWAVVIVGGGLLSAGYVLLVLGHALTPRPDSPQVAVRTRRQRLMEHVCLWLALAGLALGLRGTEVVRFLGGGIH